MKTVFVGLSGGVDSSVAALLLKQQGYDVVGVYMKNWSQDLPGVPCPWKEDYTDAKRVAVQLGIPFKMYDFETQYRHKVVDQMIKQYKAGVTPNPDITCNQEIKFKLFLETALEDGADFIATGHYARIGDGGKGVGGRVLLQAKDQTKDQTYFLYRVDSKALKKVIFPLGGLTKKEVREIAKKNGLVTAGKKESMGICFVGKVGIKDFLSQYVEPKPGEIINQAGETVGRHDGAVFYTIGQRHGLNVGGGLPYYVVGKSVPKNEVYVTTNLQDEKLWSNKLRITSSHWIASPPLQGSTLQAKKMTVRTRHLAKPTTVRTLNWLTDSNWEIELEDDIKALTPGQSAVLYSGSEVLGGGIIV